MTILHLIRALKFNQPFGRTRFITDCLSELIIKGGCITTNPHFLIIGVRRVLHAV